MFRTEQIKIIEPLLPTCQNWTIFYLHCVKSTMKPIRIKNFNISQHLIDEA